MYYMIQTRKLSLLFYEALVLLFQLFPYISEAEHTLRCLRLVTFGVVAVGRWSVNTRPTPTNGKTRVVCRFNPAAAGLKACEIANVTTIRNLSGFSKSVGKTFSIHYWKLIQCEHGHVFSSSAVFTCRFLLPTCLLARCEPSFSGLYLCSKLSVI